MPLSARRQLLASVGLGLSSRLAAGASAAPQVLLPSDVLQDSLALLRGRDPRRIQHFDGPLSRRDVVEFILLHQALNHPQLPVQRMPSAARLFIELRGARAALSGTSFQRQDLEPGDTRLALSAALVLDGEAEAGLYTVAGNTRALAVRDREGLRRLSAVSSRAWRADWQALQGLGLRELQHVSSWPQMLRMVAAGRVDLLLAPFPSRADLRLQAEGLSLLPIPGLKLVLPGSRHYLLSTQHPDFEHLRATLDAGIARLRRQGLLQRAYRECGFFNRQVSAWLRV